MICHHVLVLNKRKLDWKINKVEINRPWALGTLYLSGNGFRFQKPENSSLENVCIFKKNHF